MYQFAIRHSRHIVLFQTTTSITIKARLERVRRCNRSRTDPDTGLLTVQNSCPKIQPCHETNICYRQFFNPSIIGYYATTTEEDRSAFFLYISTPSHRICGKTGRLRRSMCYVGDAGHRILDWDLEDQIKDVRLRNPQAWFGAFET